MQEQSRERQRNRQQVAVDDVVTIGAGARIGEVAEYGEVRDQPERGQEPPALACASVEYDAEDGDGEAFETEPP